MVAKLSLVRPSRDGDQFHYWWAARRCLRLLAPADGLVAITIEGTSDAEAEVGRELGGEDVIDVAEYFGSERLDEATRVNYVQLKHSTRRSDDPWTPSELAPTFTAFAARLSKLIAHFGAERVEQTFRFHFVSNRPNNPAIAETVQTLRLGTGEASPKNVSKLKEITQLDDAELVRFCKVLRLSGREGNFLQQRAAYATEVGSYLPGADSEGPLQLKELVTKKATTEFERNPTITKLDVLAALGSDETLLLPAPCLIEVPKSVVSRDQLPEIAKSVAEYGGPTIILADGGVGKSILATQVGQMLPEASETFVYDCFGNGEYRSVSGYRHRPRDGLVQLANEMAGHMLCFPLVPSQTADSTAYMRAFKARIDQASVAIRERSDSGLLCLVIDAADNCQMAAEEAGDGASFARLLIQEKLPTNVRLIFLCRPYRLDFLNPPPDVQLIDLEPFSLAETAANLRRHFSTASSEDVAEFHRLSSHNPRVQATALAQSKPLAQILSDLGPNPTTVDALIEELLEKAIDTLRHEAGDVGRSQIDRICTALATLRPFVPLDVIAAMADVPVAAVRSFANDLQRPLLVRQDAVQFRDEPTENWFQKTFRPAQGQLTHFAANLAPLAQKSAYVAAVLPELMLQAGQFDELVTLALSEESLPTGSPIERRDVELQRLQFALKASLRAGRYADASKLALKAGGEAAADERQQSLIGANTDLGSHFLETNQMLEIVSRRAISGGAWKGSNHAYEAALLSGDHSLLGDARSRLRMAREWLRRWGRLSSEDRSHEQVEDKDIAELAMAQLNIHGPDHCAGELRRWTPRAVSYRAGRLLVGRLVDHGRFAEIDALAIAAGNSIGLVLAIVRELLEVGRLPPVTAVNRITRLVLDRRVTLDSGSDWDHEDRVLDAVTALAIAAVQLHAAPRRAIVRLLTRYMPAKPPRGLEGRFRHNRSPYLLARSLKAALQRRRLELEDVAHPELRKSLRKNRSYSGGDGERFRQRIGSVLPWYNLWSDGVAGRLPSADLGRRIDAAKEEAAKARGQLYADEPTDPANEIAQIWSDLLLTAIEGAELWPAFTEWTGRLRRPLFVPTLLRMARRAARTEGWEGVALDLAQQSLGALNSERSDAELMADGYVDIARAVLAASKDESAAYFDEAIKVASKIGQENLSRWEAMLNLATGAGKDRIDDPEIAYRLARGAELTYQYVARDKHFDYEFTVEAICGLSAPSAFAILSRWNDRLFGREYRLLPEAVQQLMSRGKLEPNLAAALVPIQADWEYDTIASAVLGSAWKSERKQQVLGHLVHYMRFATTNTRVWQKLDQVVVAAGLSLPSISEGLAGAELEVRQLREDGNSHQHIRSSDESRNTRDWNPIFAGLDITTSADLTAAYERFKATEPPYWHEDFFAHAISQVQPGREARFISAVRSSPLFSPYEVRELIERLPLAWRSRLSAKRAVGELLKEFCRRHCGEVSASRYYQLVPWEIAEQVSGLTRADLMREAVHALGQSPIPGSADGLFRLAGLLANLLQPGDARAALSYGLELMESSLEEKDGDGPWREVLTPPPSVDVAAAGYVWAALASPVAARRWEAAHVVRALAALDCVDVLQALIAFDLEISPEAFTDSRLFAYRLHARLWLMIGLARAAIESSDAVVMCADYLKAYASRSNLHVLIRQFASQALLELDRQGQIILTPDERTSLETINFSKLPKVSSRYYDRRRTAKQKSDGVEIKFNFGIDFGPYWFERVASKFDIPEQEVAYRAEKVIRDDWKLAETGNWRSDARAGLGQFREGATDHSHGSFPRVDDLQFYLSYHAMMTVAGELLEELPLHEDPEDDWDNFSRWLSEHGLTRRDGCWLADRRDPTPLDLITLPRMEAQEWAGSLIEADYIDLLGWNKNEVTLSGAWMQKRGQREQSVTISSALVGSERSIELARPC